MGRQGIKWEVLQGGAENARLGWNSIRNWKTNKKEKEKGG